MLIRSTTRMPQATADRFFRISPNRRFGALEAYFKPKNFLPQYSANRKLPASGFNRPIFQTFTKSLIWPRKAYSCQTQPRVIAKQQDPKDKAPNFVCFFIMIYSIFIHLKYFQPYFSTLSTLFLDLISTLSTLSTLKK